MNLILLTSDMVLSNDLPASLPVALVTWSTQGAIHEIVTFTPSLARGDVLIGLGLVDSGKGAVAQLVRALNS